MIRAYRASYLLHKGDIPAGLQVCHSCDNPTCVNPDHLFLGTQLDNVRDMDAKGRSRRIGSKGSDNAASKLDEDDAEAIRSLRLNGWIYKDLAAKFQVHLSTIWRVCNDVNWR